VSRTEVKTPLEAAHEYRRRGWAVLPLASREKFPTLPAWTSLQLHDAELPEYFGNDANLGIVLGSRSGGLCDVDLDAPEAISVADFFLAPTDLIFGRASKPNSHRLYFVEPNHPLARPRPQKFAAPDGSTLVELRGDGQQTAFPPSIHPTGEIYEFFSNGEAASVPGSDLLHAVSCVAAAALLARQWPRPGRRNDAANAVAGMLMRAAWSAQQAGNFVEAVATAAGDDEVRQRVRDVISTAKRLAARRTATGTPTLAQIMGDTVVKKVREWLGFSSHLEVSVASPEFAVSGASWPEPLAPEAFYGLAGEIVRAIEPHSEADPAALLIQLLAAFGNVTGRGPFFRVERHDHHANLFVLIVGATAKGRKGTSWFQVVDLFARADRVWASTRIHGGTGSGEGVIWHVRDQIMKGDKVVEEGVDDKRLLLLESEFAQVLAVVKREGNTVSEVLRRAWDGTPLQTLTKNSPARATDAHISLVGHITADELLRHLDKTEIANGLLNRFILVCARRSKMLPEGGSLSEEGSAALAKKVRAAVEFSPERRELTRDASARQLWREIYGDLSEGRAGLFGSVISRAEAQVLRLSMLYALLDRSPFIRREHLMAAVALWQYAESSASYIFGEALGDAVADEILRALRANPGGLTRSQVRDLFGRNKTESQIDRAVAILLNHHLIEMRTDATGGRPAQRLVARVYVTT
jgi:hypothetical protein